MKDTFTRLLTDRVRRQANGQRTACPEECTCTEYENNRKDVNCYGAGKMSIPANIPGDTSRLNLSMNSIREIRSGTLDNLHQIQYLDLSNNKIEVIEPTTFKDLGNVKYLDLSSNKIKNMTLNVLGPTALKLEVLKISDTEMRSIPDLQDRSSVYMTKLTHLFLGHNRFPSILPERIPPSVTFLDLSCLDTRVLKSNAFSGLEKLQEVVIRGCKKSPKKIESVERGTFISSAKLQRIDLSGNHLTRVPPDLPVSLIELDVSKNRIADLKEGECATDALLKESLHLINRNGEFDEFGGGHLTKPVGSVLSRLRNLQILKLNGNTLTSLCIDDFLNMENLRVLNMSGCRLSLFHPHTFVYPRNLMALDLSGNQLMHFESEDLSLLEEVYLQNNILEDVGSLTRRKIPSLKKANFEGNKWRCDCNLQPLLKLIGYHSGEIDFINLHAYSVHYACSVPLEFKGRPLLTLDMNSLVCEKEGSVNIVAIAAPTSLGFIILLVVIVIVIAMRQDKKRIAKKRAQRLASGLGAGHRNEAFTLNLTQPYMDTTLERKRCLGDAAILCHSLNQTWVTDRLLPEIRRHGDSTPTSVNAENATIDRNAKRLVLNVFTVGKNIKIDRLSKCIDSNKRLLIVVTHNFIEESSSLLLLNIIRERSINNAEDSIIILVLDAIAWSSMPQSLKFLMVEKTFFQYPQDPRNDSSFWEVLCPYLYRQAPAQNVEIPNRKADNYWEQEDLGEHVFVQNDTETPPNRPPTWNTGGRKMKLSPDKFEDESRQKRGTGLKYGIIEEQTDNCED